MSMLFYFESEADLDKPANLGVVRDLELAKLLRKNKRFLPLIILDDLGRTDESRMFECLAWCDYILPADSSEARVEAAAYAIARRCRLAVGNSVMRVGDLWVDFRMNKGESQGQDFTLTPRESEVLEAIWWQRPRVVSREELLVKVWRYDDPLGIDTRTVDIHINHIRKKIEVDPNNPTVLVTVRNEGYMIPDDLPLFIERRKGVRPVAHSLFKKRKSS
jgi:two-component system alkaline phosphatase synthesis response regulator PhoP